MSKAEVYKDQWASQRDDDLVEVAEHVSLPEMSGLVKSGSIPLQWMLLRLCVEISERLDKLEAKMSA